jgi:glycosyltransferase involved in cell wall biosynthesis
MSQAEPSSNAAPASAPGRARLAALLSHPIQYLVPLLRTLAARPEIDLSVYFMDDTGLRSGFIEGMGRTMQWDVPLLDGYRHAFLPNLSPDRDSRTPLSKINPAFLPILARGRFDALYMHGYTSATEWMALAAARALRIPVVFHGDVVLDSQAKRSPLARELFRRTICASIDAALVPSTRARAFYERYGFPAERVYWAPLCVDNAFWMAKAEELRPRRAALRAEMGVDAELPVVLYVANMRAVKRPVDAVKAFERMKTRASLVMVGEGPLFDEVKAHVEANRTARVHLVGGKNQSELPACYASADAFLMTSTHEVNPLVIREAMCCGLPLVVSDKIEVTSDFVHEGDNGFTYPMGDVGAAADRLDRVLADPAARAAMGERSREIIRPWNYDVTAQGIVDALAAVVRRRRAD